VTILDQEQRPATGAAVSGKDNIKGTIMYKPVNENLTTPPVMNPHSPANNGYKQQPVDIPGVLDQTRRLYQPYVPSATDKE
jgi:hypothetical protein